jgi:hypothetical protein
MRYPSVKTLLDLTHHRDDRPTALKVRKVLDERTKLQDQWGRDLQRHTSKLDDAKLAAADKLLGNHGVEWLTFECQRDNYHDPDGFAYSNAGDTYNATLVLYKRSFRVTTYGDMVENHEKHCAACRKRSREEG